MYGVMLRYAQPRRQTKRRGAILLDVMVGMFVLSLSAMTVFAMIPAAHRAQALASEEAKASHLATRMVERLQQLKTTELTPAILTQLGLVDAGQSASPYTFSSVPLDDATGMSPSKALRNGTGRFGLTNIAGNSVRIDLELRWRSASGRDRVLTTGTVVGGYR